MEVTYDEVISELQKSPEGKKELELALARARTAKLEQDNTRLREQLRQQEEQQKPKQPKQSKQPKQQKKEPQDDGE